MHSPDDGDQILLRLLALKRHELPPPGFFDRLPDRILVSIRAGSEITDGPWWKRVWLSIRREPMVGVSYAALGVGAVVFGVSVLQTAIEVDQTSPAVLRGMMPGSLDALAVQTSMGVQPGVYYRVPESGGGSLLLAPSVVFPFDVAARTQDLGPEVRATTVFFPLPR